MVKLADEVRVIDADTHMTEVHDLFTKRAPKGYEDRVPRVTTVDGVAMWTVEGSPLGPARAGGVIGRDGQKSPLRRPRSGGSSVSIRAPTTPSSG